MHQKAHSFTSLQGVTLPYLLAQPTPAQRDPAKRWPFVLFLHGRGERGSDLALLKRHGLPKVVESWADSPFILLSPQCPAASDWAEQTHTLYELVLDAQANLPIDPKRCYLTGLSMGGRGSWVLAATHPTLFAAMLPICARIPTPDFLDRIHVLKHLPIWVFHGAKDQVVPSENGEKLVAALRAVGGNVRYTVYPDADHDSWTATYANAEIYRWLLAQGGDVA